jgi:hypothetical protein
MSSNTYLCDCGFESSSFFNFRRHLNRKRPCYADYLKNQVQIDSNPFQLNSNPSQLNSNPLQLNSNPIQTNTHPSEINRVLCEKCNKSFKTKDNYAKHVKNTCNGLPNTTCKTCFKKFASPQSRYNHEKREICVIDEDIDKRVVNVVNNSVTTNNVTVVNNTIDNSVTNNVTIQLRPFGEENLDYLKADDLLRRFKKYGRLEDVMVRALQMVHFNDEHPENMNIYMSNLRGRHVHTYDGTSFIAQPKELIMEVLSESVRSVLEDMHEGIDDNILSKSIDDIGEKLDDEDKRFLTRLNARLESQLYNGRRVANRTAMQL